MKYHKNPSVQEQKKRDGVRKKNFTSSSSPSPKNKHHNEVPRNNVTSTVSNNNIKNVEKLIIKNTYIHNNYSSTERQTFTSLPCFG